MAVGRRAGELCRLLAILAHGLFQLCRCPAGGLATELLYPVGRLFLAQRVVLHLILRPLPARQRRGGVAAGDTTRHGERGDGVFLAFGKVGRVAAVQVLRQRGGDQRGAAGAVKLRLHFREERPVNGTTSTRNEPYKVFRSRVTTFEIAIADLPPLSDA